MAPPSSTPRGPRYQSSTKNRPSARPRVRCPAALIEAFSPSALVSRFTRLLILLTISSLSRTGVFGLKCYVCSEKENPTFTLNPSPSFRIVDELAQDHCRHLEEVQCDRDHDICLTIVQYKIDEGKRAPRSYSVAKGCYQSSALDLGGSLYKRGCHKETAEVKEDISNAQSRFRRINIHQAMRYTCICNTNKCNAASSTVTRHSFLSNWPPFRSCLTTLVITALTITLLLRNP